ncbi:MAG: protein-disulfide reductase DsbD domain-containing protein [Candidatus Sulfotelmatobacter sp.]
MTFDQRMPLYQVKIRPGRGSLLALILLAASGLASAQIPPKAPVVTMDAVPLLTAQRAKETMVNLNFRVPAGYHINSNMPKSEYLLPTALKMDLPTDIILGKIDYPAGEDTSFPFSPDEKLSVYTGDFTISLGVHPLHSVVPGKYVMHGVLRYQGCDNAQCFPPKNVPVSFEVKVVKEPPEHHANPAQSPHIHN